MRGGAVDLRVPGGLLMVPAVVVLGHGLLYAFLTVVLGLAALGVGGLVVLGMVSEGTAEALPALVFVGGFGGLTVVLMLAVTVVLLAFGSALLWGAVRGLLGRGGQVGLAVLSLLSFLFCGLWAFFTLTALNPLFLAWAVACLLSALSGIFALVAHPAE